MEFAWKVMCLVCASTNVTGSLSEPQTGWTKEQVLANAIHNPGCRITKFNIPPEGINTTESTDENDPNEAVYSITLAD